ncbi:DUF2877 domain-containing protein [Thermosediminibacter litoriperuensis]|uniref:Uncharacterized protein DUF2877 n=1 Tax=Thermosediminibacter litoriperuensis TaxID=291989 RepID=A0A5S5AFW4_9FIRM|nr:DUF2877 domain-containing protein [Thermosediminibacter litoriperuensis]TYP48664.1 uncharacterized protein DUF2877 [Thermosediminibacter litoriperuensis]
MKYLKAFAGKNALRILSSKKVGKIHSVFKNAFNILYDDAIIGIVKNEDYVGLYNISVNYEGNFEQLLRNWREVNITFENNILFFGKTPLFNLFEIEEFSLLNYVKKKVVQIERKYDKEDVLNKIEFLEKILDTKLTQMGDDLIISKVIDKIKRFESSDISKLIGLGPGLTPAGDDFISGYMMGTNFLHYLNGKNIMPLIKENLKSLKLYKDKTNLISFHMLKTSAVFGGPKIAIDLLISLFHPDEQPFLKDNFNKLLDIGATSGYFWASGIIKSIKKFEEV